MSLRKDRSRRLVWMLVAVACGLAIGGVRAADDVPPMPVVPPSNLLVLAPQRDGATEKALRASGDSERAEPVKKPDEEPSGVAPPMSAAEKLARLRRSVENDQRRLSELQASLQDPTGNFARTEEEFRQLDQQFEQVRKTLNKSKSPDAAADERAESERRLKETQDARERAKQRFEAAIAERRAAQEAVQNIEQKIRADKDAIDKLLGQTPVASPPSADGGGSRPVPNAGGAPGAPTPPPSNSVPVTPPPPTTVADLLQSVTGQRLVPPGPAPAATPSASPPTLPPATNGTPVGVNTPGTAPLPAVGPTNSAPALAANPTAPPKDKVLREAAEAAQEKVAAAQAAELEARSVTERAELLRRNIDVERRLRDAARQRFDETDEALQRLTEQMHQAVADGRDATGIIDQLQEAEERRRTARNESRRIATHLDELQTEYSRLQDEQISALEEAQRKRDAADEALRRVASLNNPFSLRNIVQWLIEHLPRVLFTIVAVGLTLWFSRTLGRRLLRFLAMRSMRGTPDERENRARTLAGVLHNAINVGTVAAGVVTILDEIGVPVGPVMGGAAVLGLAVAFGAQSLIKDYFTGFMLLSEQQYLVNDVVQIGEISGQVERISLRMTVLRDAAGNAHFIPHGQITTVTNMTHTWSRAVFDIAVSYSENIDEVIDELRGLCAEMRLDPEFGPLILEDVTMLGVDQLGEWSITIKFLLKTKPMQQWPVKRELLRRIKNRFSQLGIEAPFPQRTVHVRNSIPTAA